MKYDTNTRRCSSCQLADILNVLQHRIAHRTPPPLPTSSPKIAGLWSWFVSPILFGTNDLSKLIIKDWSYRWSSSCHRGLRQRTEATGRKDYPGRTREVKIWVAAQPSDDVRKTIMLRREATLAGNSGAVIVLEPRFCLSTRFARVLNCRCQ